MSAEVTSFPRGKLNEPSTKDKGGTTSRKRPSVESKLAEQRAQDTLFGTVSVDSKKGTKKRKKSNESSSQSAGEQHQSLLPLGGGAVHVARGVPVIEGLSFSKLTKGFRMLGCVREAHPDLIVFSLPNLWTGFMLRGDEHSVPCNEMVHVGQFLSVVIVKAVQVPAKGGMQRRRIQVSCLPGAVNSIGAVRALQQEASDADDMVVPGGLLQCQVVSMEDHGVVMDIGPGRRGFLAFDDIDVEYTVDDDDDSMDEGDDDNGDAKKEENSSVLKLAPGRILECVVKPGTKRMTNIVSLTLPADTAQSMPTKAPTSLSQLQPGMLVQARIEKTCPSGVCVTFFKSRFRGAIETQHLSGYWTPKDKKDTQPWADAYPIHHTMPARIVATDVATKVVRLSVQTHLLELTMPPRPPPVGTVIDKATVVRLDPGVGALLAYKPTATDDDYEVAAKCKLGPVSKHPSFADATRVRSVYVHISKSMDSVDENDKVPHDAFAKSFAIGTQHSVRIVSNSNWVDGTSAGAAASKYVDAQILNFHDVAVGQVFTQVPITVSTDKGTIIVDLGLGVEGIIPEMHLFDKAITSPEYRAQVRRKKFVVGAKVDVRVLDLSSEKKKVFLTAKKPIVKTKHVIQSFDDVAVGDRGTGFVSSVDDHGILVSFFNGVYGRLTARTLRHQAGVENHKLDYGIGDILECRVTQIKTKVQQHHASSRTFRNIILGLETPSATANEKPHDPSEILALNMKAVLPLKSMRVDELVLSHSGSRSIVPGYAIVSVKAKYVVQDEEQAEGIETINCKLPYDQLVDDYGDTAYSAEKLDEFAASMLTVGKKVKSKGILICDPQKPAIEYLSGIGGLATVSIRPQLVQAVADPSAGPAFVTSAEDLHPGLQVIGFVKNIDDRHGAFVAYSNRLHGLVTNKMGGRVLPLYATVTTEIIAVETIRGGAAVKISAKPVLNANSSVTSKLSKKAGVEYVKEGDVIPNAKIQSIEFHQVKVSLDDDRLPDNIKISARLHCTMANGALLTVGKKKKSIKNAQQQVTSVHPFHDWKVGQTLNKLRVLKVDNTKDSMYLELTNDDEAQLVQEQSRLEKGGKIKGIVYSYSGGSGLWVSVSPGVLCHVPPMQIVNDAAVLNDLESYIPIGCRVQGTIMDSKAWTARRAEYLKSFRFSKNKYSDENKDTRLVSLLDLENKPKRGDLVVGRINRNMTERGWPSLLLELRNGFVGRCCISELTDPDDWENMPLGTHDLAKVKSMDPKGKPKKEAKEKDGKEAKDIKKSEDEPSEKRSERNDKTADRNRGIADDPTKEYGAYSTGKFVRCRVLDTSKRLLDVSLRETRLEGDLDDDAAPSEGETVQAYVITTNRKGCFLRLSRNLKGRALVKELSDAFLHDAAMNFPTGRLVVGKVKSIRKDEKKKTMDFDLDLRESVLLDAEEKLTREDVAIGKKFKGLVTRLEDYGVFVRLEGSDIVGLAHKSECSDKYIRNLKNLYSIGDKVKALVIKKDDQSKRIGLSLKASHFTDTGDSDEEDDESEDEKSMEGAVKMLVDDDDDSDAEMLDTEKADSDDDEESDDEGDGSSASEDSDSEDMETNDLDTKPEMDTNVGFDWGNDKSKGEADSEDEDDDDDSSDSDNDDDDGPNKASHKSRKKQAQRRKEELEISKREVALADGTADENPETEGDFERLLASEPNSSELWIRFMAFHLSLADIAAAREVADRAFARIEFREETEKLNVWCALMTLELKYGTEASLKAAFDRACQQNNPKHVHLRYAEMLEKGTGSYSLASAERTQELYKKMCKKFRTKKTVWLAHMEYLLKNGREEEALAVSKKSILSLPSYKHVETMSKFAQLVFEHGTPERARTLFDGILQKNPKRLDLFFVFADKEAKHGEVSTARSLYERVCNPQDESLKLKLSDKKMKSFFKKWYAFEESNGTEQQRDSVKQAAKEYVERTMA